MTDENKKIQKLFLLKSKHPGVMEELFAALGEAGKFKLTCNEDRPCMPGDKAPLIFWTRRSVTMSVAPSAV